MSSELIYSKIESLPENLKKEATDFIDFLLTKKKPEETKKIRKAGFLKDQIEMSPDFDKPLDDFKEYMQ